MPILGNYGTNNDDGRRLEGIILGILTSGHNVQTPWVDYDRLKDSTKALEAFFPQALSFLSKNNLIEKNDQNEYRITERGIIDYNDRTNNNSLA